MLDNIKSKLIFEKVFSVVREKIILKLANYNKSLQKKLGRSLIDYKVMSMKYIIYEEKNKGKLYDADDDKLLYIGEFMNGKKNGKGKEFNDKGKLIFEGEFFKGKRWNGYGFEYNYRDILIFEGEYLNGKRNGKGKEYNYGELLFGGIFKHGNWWNRSGKNLEFEGEYLNGERNGKGKEYYDNGQIYFEGEYLNGERNGYGKEYYNDGKIKFEGKYLNGVRTGIEKKYYDNGQIKIEGEYKMINYGI